MFVCLNVRYVCVCDYCVICYNLVILLMHAKIVSVRDDWFDMLTVGCLFDWLLNLFI